MLNYPVGQTRDASCVDGDPACDADGTADGTCHFGVSVCLLNTDSRFPACVPSEVVGYKIKNRKPGTVGFNQELFDLNNDVLLGFPAVTSSCTAPRLISVSLRPGSSGPRKGRLNIRAESYDGVVSDRDRLKLICLP